MGILQGPPSPNPWKAKVNTRGHIGRQAKPAVTNHVSAEPVRNFKGTIISVTQCSLPQQAGRITPFFLTVEHRMKV